MLTVWLIRHAESTANSGAATSDWATIPLTARGREQASYIASAMPEPPSLVVTSPFLRAQESALPTLQRFPDVPHADWPVHEFTYLTRFRGIATTTEQRRQAVEAFWQQGDPWYRDDARAESFADFIARVEATSTRLRQTPAGFLVLFSHELFIRALYWSLLTASFAATPERMRLYRGLSAWLAVPNAAIIPLRLEGATDVWLHPVTTAHLPAHLVL